MGPKSTPAKVKKLATTKKSTKSGTKMSQMSNDCSSSDEDDLEEFTKKFMSSVQHIADSNHNEEDDSHDVGSNSSDEDLSPGGDSGTCDASDKDDSEASKASGCDASDTDSSDNSDTSDIDTNSDYDAQENSDHGAEEESVESDCDSEESDSDSEDDSNDTRSSVQKSKKKSDLEKSSRNDISGSLAECSSSKLKTKNKKHLDPDGIESEASDFSDESIGSESDNLSTSEDTDNKTKEKKLMDDDFKKMREELSNVPFNELQKLKEKIGVKAYNKAMFGLDGFDKKRKKTFTRENKNRPSEMTSKRPVSVFREIVQVKKKTHRDPRFDDLSGAFDEKIFRQTYSFIDNIKQREKTKLVSQYQKEKDADKKNQIQNLIRRMNQQSKSEDERRARESRDQERRKEELDQIRQGKRPYYLKKADKRKLELAEKFKQLEKSGKVDKYLAKKRKKNAAKDRKHLPNKKFASS